MTDIGTVGFGADTSELVKLQDELDRLKAKVDSLNSSLKGMDPASSAAKAKLAELKVATNDFQGALGNLVDKQLAAGKTTQALDTIVKSTGATYQQAAQAVKEVITAHAQAEGAVGKTASALGAAGRAAAESGAEASRSGGFFSTLAAMLGLSASTSDKHTIATRALGAAHHSASEGTKVLRESVHTLIPALEEAGLKISLLTQYSGALRAGLPALGLAIAGGIGVAVAKASDEADLARRRLEGLAGVKMGGEFADSLKKVSTELGISRAAAAPAFESLSKIANLNTPPNGVRVIEPGQPELLKASAITADNLAKSYEAIFMQLRLGGAETAQATAAANKFFDELAKNGKVTSQMVDDLRKVAPQAATTLANAFTQGRLNVDQFIESLKKTPISLEKILELLPKIREGGASAFKELQQNPITVASAVDRLKESFETLWQTIDGGTKDRPGAIAQFIGQVAEDLDSFNTAVKNAKAGTDDWNTNLGVLFGTIKMIAIPFRQMGTDLADFVKGLSGSDTELGSSAGLFETLGHAVGVAGSAIKEFAIVVGSGLGEGLASIGNFVMASIQQLTDWANQAISLAQQVASAIANATSNPGTPSAPQSVDAMGAVTGFATGGSFVVGGSGGTDSQLIQFMATPGEKITIDTPDAGGAAAKTLGSLIPSNDNNPAAQSDVISAHIAEDFRNQTAALSDKLGILKDAIVAAIANVTSAVKAIAIQGTAAAGGVPVAAAGTSTSSSTGLGSTSSALSSSASSGGGGGINFKKDPNEAKAAQAMAQSQAAANKAEQDAYNKLTPQQKADYDSGGLIQHGTLTPVSATPGFKSPATALPGTGLTDGVGRAPYAGQLDAQGMPIKNPPYATGTDPMTAGGQAYPIGTDPMTAGGQAYPIGTDPMTAGADGVNKISDATATVSDNVKDQTDKINSIGDQTNRYLDGVEGATQDSVDRLRSVDDSTRQGTDATQAGTDATRQGAETTQAGLSGIEGAAGETTSAVETGTANIASSVGSLGSEIASALSSLSGAGGGASGGGGMSGGGGYSSGGSGGYSAGYSGRSSGYDSGVAAGQGSSVQGASGGAGAGEGFTPSQAYFEQFYNAEQAPAQSFAAGESAMAIGGQFTVKGAGTTDTERVEFMATPGETVTVTPPGGTPPPNPTFGSGPSTKSGLMAFATGGQFTLGDAMGEPSLAGADVVAAHMADNTRDQTANLKDKLETVADKIIEAIRAGSNMIRNAVTAAFDKMMAEAKAAAAARVQSAGAGSSGATYSGGQPGSAFGIDASGNNSFGVHVFTDQENEQSMLAHGYYKTPDGGFRKAIQYTGSAGFAEGGAFTVPGGTGGSDSVNLAIKASPGEKIIVLPPEKAKALDDLKNAIRVSPESLSKFMPALQDNIPGGGSGAMSGSVIAGGAAAAVAGIGGRGDERSVKIFVQQGVSADTFIQSRAQVERAMRK